MVLSARYQLLWMQVGMHVQQWRSLWLQQQWRSLWLLQLGLHEHESLDDNLFDLVPNVLCFLPVCSPVAAA